MKVKIYGMQCIPLQPPTKYIRIKLLAIEQGIIVVYTTATTNPLYNL